MTHWKYIVKITLTRRIWFYQKTIFPWSQKAVVQVIVEYDYNAVIQCMTHACQNLCHIIDGLHVDLFKNCQQKCGKVICELNHRCSAIGHFGKECGKCNVTVQKLHPKCQHVVQVSCSFDPSKAQCTSPCEEVRRCGHKCQGHCGFCRICDEAQVKEILFGSEDEDNARFIELADRKHAIEVNGLLCWMKNSSKKPNLTNIFKSIQFKSCPKCTTVIRSTKVLNTFIQANINDIEQVKRKMHGDSKQDQTMQRSLYEKVKGC